MLSHNYLDAARVFRVRLKHPKIGDVANFLFENKIVTKCAEPVAEDLYERTRLLEKQVISNSNFLTAKLT